MDIVVVVVVAASVDVTVDVAVLVDALVVVVVVVIETLVLSTGHRDACKIELAQTCSNEEHRDSAPHHRQRSSFASFDKHALQLVLLLQPTNANVVQLNCITSFVARLPISSELGVACSIVNSSMRVT